MIRLNDLTIGYGHRILLQHASATIPAGELVALVGRNGTGKSTLLRAIAGLGERLGGEIRLDGHSLETLSPQQLATTVSFVTTERVRIPNLRCEDVVALGRAPYTNWIGRVQEQDKAIVERSLELVGMAAFAGKTMDRMSDGECQRVMIARALAQDTPIILLDEPTSFLDLPNRYELCTLLRRLAHDHRKCILFSTHELDIALSLADGIALDELDIRMASARAGDGRRELHLDVAGGIQDEGQNEHLPRPPGGTVQALVEQHLGMLDEAGLDAPGGVTLAPLGGEVEDLGVAVAVAGAVAHQQDGGVVHAGFSGEGAVALRKRCVKAGS